MRRLRCTAGLAALLLCLSLEAASAPVVASSAYLRPQTLVKVDGDRRINLFCMGQGSPTVLLDAGAGGSSVVWRHVQAQIAKTTRVCSYDRAGYGFSDAATRASDVRNSADDLHRLLIAASIPLPVIYVGHSIAGLYGVYFNAKYPEALSGAVFVDPAFGTQETDLLATLSPAKQSMWLEANRKTVEQQRGCLELAKRGALASPVTQEARDCNDPTSYPEPLDALLTKENVREGASVASNAAGLSEIESSSGYPGHRNVDAEEMQSVKANFGNKPLVILTHTKPNPLPPAFDQSDAKNLEEAWNAGHERLALASTRGSNTLVPGAAHFIQLDRPDVVIDAIQRAVAMVRGPPS